MNDYKLEHICSYTGTLGSPPEIIGPVPEGIRVDFYSTGGEITGPNIRGKVCPVGGDWVTVRKDGVAYLDVRTTFETHDGALILVTYQGVVDFGEDGYVQISAGRGADGREASDVATICNQPSWIPLVEPTVLLRSW
jgi:hypothetical protein